MAITLGKAKKWVDMAEVDGLEASATLVVVPKIKRKANVKFVARDLKKGRAVRA
jgi:hypothetical protein